jgi:hypothetical protein
MLLAKIPASSALSLPHIPAYRTLLGNFHAQHELSLSLSLSLTVAHSKSPIHVPSSHGLTGVG